MDQTPSSQTLRFDNPVTAASPQLPRLLTAIAEGASARDLEREHPYALIDLIRQARLGALRLDPQDGGAGASNRELFTVVIRLGEADPNVAHILRNHFSFVERFLRHQRNPKLAKWRQAVANGAIFGLAYGELETKQVGSREVQTSLTPAGDGYRLNGTKYYSTGSLYADYIVVRADAGKEGGVAIVPADRTGLELLDDWDGFGQRLTGTGTTILHDVAVSAEEVVLDSEGTFYSAAYTGSVPQLVLTAINAGILRATLQDAAALVRRRQRSFSHALAALPSEDPLLQQVVGQISADAFAAEAAVLAASDALDRLDTKRRRGEPDEDAAHEASLATSQAKVIVDELAIRSASRLLDTGGASATKKTQNLDRHWRNARTLASHNPGSYKAQAIGAHIISGARLPVSGFF